MRSTPAIPLLARNVVDRRALLRLAAQLGVASVAGPAFAQQQQAFKVRWIRPTAGRLPSSFAPFGGLIAADEINAAGDIPGHQIARVEEDDEASPAKESGPAADIAAGGASRAAFMGEHGASHHPEPRPSRS